MKDIDGVTIGHVRHIISLFADDTTIYVTNPTKLLKYLMPLLKDFGDIAGFAINYTKPELYPVGFTGAMHTEIESSYNFRWVTSSWRHLGVLIPLHLKDLFKVNYTPLFNRIRSILRDWSSKWLTWLEQIDLLKSMVLPQFLFLFQALPTEIPVKYITL